MRPFDVLIEKARKVPVKTAAAVWAEDEEVLLAARAAHEKNVAETILTGRRHVLEQMMAVLNMNPQDYTIAEAETPDQAAQIAARLVHTGQADLLWKGLVDTKTFLQAVLDKENGLRSGKILSHAAVLDLPSLNHLIILSDAAFIPLPNLEQKKAMIRYDVQIAHACGIPCPKVAPLAAVEVVNSKMPATVEADLLRQANVHGELPGCIVDGPLSLDIALDPAAAKEKRADQRPCAGKADILIFPNIEAANTVYKTMAHLIPGARIAALVTGTARPVVLTSRADPAEVKFNSLCLASILQTHLLQENDAA
jgi:phosphate butyryltransferase